MAFKGGPKVTRKYKRGCAKRAKIGRTGQNTVQMHHVSVILSCKASFHSRFGGEGLKKVEYGLQQGSLTKVVILLARVS